MLFKALVESIDRSVNFFNNYNECYNDYSSILNIIREFAALDKSKDDRSTAAAREREADRDTRREFPYDRHV